MKDSMHLRLDATGQVTIADLTPQTAPSRTPFLLSERREPSPQRTYLWPSRYFHYCMFYDRKAQQTCWLPEGYNQ